MIKIIDQDGRVAQLTFQPTPRLFTRYGRLEFFTQNMVDSVYEKWRKQQNYETEKYSFEIEESKSEPSLPKDWWSILAQKELQVKERQIDKQHDPFKKQTEILPQMVLAEDLPELFKMFPDQFPSLKHQFPVKDPKELYKLWKEFDMWEINRNSDYKLFRPFAPKIIYRSAEPFGLFYNRLCFTFTRVLPFPSELKVQPFESVDQEDIDTSKTDTEVICCSSQEKNSMKITDLPDDILLIIFDQFTLQFKLSLRAVSQKFAHFIEASVVCRKKSLKLFSRKQDYVGYCKLITTNNLESFEHIKFKDTPADDDVIMRVNQYTLPSLTQMYCNLETLVVYFDKTSQLQSLPDFLAFLNLKSLSLLGEIENSKSYGQTFVDRLADAISQMTILTHLDILVKNLFSYTIPSKTSESGTVVFLTLDITSIMDKLEVFSLYGRVDNLKDLLSALGPNCSHLQLESTGLTESTIEELIKVNPGIKETIKKLVIRVVLPKQIKALCSNFTSLSSLEIFTSKQTSFEEFLKYINNIKNLTDLRIGSFLKLYSGEQEQEVDGADVQQWPVTRSLPHLRRLTIESMHSFRDCRLGWILEAISVMFPNIEKLNLGLSSTVSMASVFSDLEKFKFLVEFRLFYTGKLQSYLIPSHQKNDFYSDQLAKHFLYKKTRKYWEMIEEGFFPLEVVRETIFSF